MKINEILHKHYLIYTEKMSDKLGLVGYPFMTAVINAAIDAGILEVDQSFFDDAKPYQIKELYTDLTEKINEAINPDVKK